MSLRAAFESPTAFAERSSRRFTFGAGTGTEEQERGRTGFLSQVQLTQPRLDTAESAPRPHGRSGRLHGVERGGNCRRAFPRVKHGVRVHRPVRLSVRIPLQGALHARPHAAGGLVRLRAGKGGVMRRGRSSHAQPQKGAGSEARLAGLA